MNDEQKKTDELYKNREWARNKSIAYFNSLNAAINLVTAKGTNFQTNEELLAKIDEFKNHFIEKHNAYYLSTIVAPRAAYDKTAAPKKLKLAKTLKALEKTWLGLSADERNDDENIALKDSLKLKLAPKVGDTAEASA